MHGAKAAGMGTAFVGLADDPSAILFNPAGLSQLKERQLYIGITGLTLSTEYTDTGGLSEKTLSEYFFVPHLFLVIPYKRNLTAGLGLYAPFGIGGRQWRETGLTRYVSTKNFISTVSLNPTLAWNAGAGLSLAIGIDYMMARMEAARMMDQSAFGSPDAKSEIGADGDGWGYNLGLRYSLNDSLSFGAAYRSSVDVDYTGDMSISGIAPPLQALFGSSVYGTGVSTSNTFPEIYSLGVSAKAGPRITVAADVELVRWSSFDSILTDIKSEVPGAGLVDNVAILDWSDSWQYKLGVDYRVSERYSLRAGYALIKGVVPESSLEPGNPDSDQQNFSLGLGLGFDSMTVDIFYDYARYDDRSVDNNILDGIYSNSAHYLGVSSAYEF